MSITPTAMTTAAIMIGTSSTRPTAVSTESSENTMSSRTICTSTPPKLATLPPAAVWASSPSSDSWISVVAFQSRNRPPPMRITSRVENVAAADGDQRLR